MGIKPGKIYRSADKRPYTRLEYIPGAPQPKITVFDMGNLSREFELEFSLISTVDAQITHNALEAARVAMNRYIQSKVGENNYALKVRVYPHQVLRENKMASGAGADRVSQGMTLSFGFPVGRAARVKKGQKVMSLQVNKMHADEAKNALKRAAHKLPIHCRIALTSSKSGSI